MARTSICEDDRGARSLGAVTVTIARLAIAVVAVVTVLLLWGGEASASDRPGLVTGLVDRVDDTLDPMLGPVTAPLEPLTEPVIAPVASTADRVVQSVVAPAVEPLHPPAPSTPPALPPAPTTPVPVPGSPEPTDPKGPPAPSEPGESPSGDAVERDPGTPEAPRRASNPIADPPPSPDPLGSTVTTGGPGIAPVADADADASVDGPSPPERRSPSARDSVAPVDSGGSPADAPVTRAVDRCQAGGTFATSTALLGSTPDLDAIGARSRCRAGTSSHLRPPSADDPEPEVAPD